MSDLVTEHLLWTEKPAHEQWQPGRVDTELRTGHIWKTEHGHIAVPKTLWTKLPDGRQLLAKGDEVPGGELLKITLPEPEATHVLVTVFGRELRPGEEEPAPGTPWERFTFRAERHRPGTSMPTTEPPELIVHAVLTPAGMWLTKPPEAGWS